MIYIIATIIKVFFLIAVFLLGLSTVLTWAERKQSALIQDRIGPNRASILGLRIYGLFHPIADGIKMMMKEDYIPEGADKFVHTLGPVLAIFPALVNMAVIPFGPPVVISGKEISLQIADVSIGILFILALASLSIYGIFLGGWASYNKWSLLGGLRAAAQMVSYEVVLGLTLIPAILYYGSIKLNDIVAMQSGYWLGFIPKWGIFPLLPAFIIFFIAAFAENKRIPFDLPEGESEIIGYFLEYSGMKFAMFFLAEFMEIVILSALIVTIFFGGWHFPYLEEVITSPNLKALIGFISFFIKIVIMCYIQLLIRWTYPRFRYDQIMKLCWKGLLPISLALVFIYGFIFAIIH